MKIERILLQIKKQMLEPNNSVRFIKSGILLLDSIIKGIPSWTELYGKESSGKSTLALHFAKQAIEQKIPVLYIDAEEGFDEERAKRIGLNMNFVALSPPETIEKTFETIKRFCDKCKEGELNPPLIIWDPITNCPIENEVFHTKKKKKEEQETEKDEEGQIEYETDKNSSIAERARIIRAQIRKLIVPPTGANFLIINHSITNIMPYQEKEITPGGTSLKFQAQLRIILSGNQTWKNGKGKNARLFIRKSKFSIPGQRIELPLNYSKGFQEQFSILFSEKLISKGIVKPDRKENSFKVNFENNEYRISLLNCNEVFQENKALLEFLIKENSEEVLIGNAEKEEN